MKVRKKYINWKSGFVRFKYFEINWSVFDWALLFNISFSNHYIFLQILCLSLIIESKNETI